MADPITPGQIRRPTTPTGPGPGAVQMCKEECARRFPRYYKDPLQKESYDECIRNCEASGNPDNPNPPTPTPTPDTSPECPEGTGKTYEGCPCGEAYGTKTGSCVSGYKFVKREPWTGNKDGVVYSEGMVGTCHCQKAIDDWRAKKGASGEFKWSSEVQALLQRILDRANMLLDQPLGLSDEERDAIYSRIYEKIKGAERPAIQSQMDVMSRQGLLGSPYAERSITGIQRGTTEALGSAERDIEIEEARRRYEQLMGTTAMVQSLFGTGMSAEQMRETLSAGRRGEGQNAMQMLLNYLAMIYGGQDNSYWQAILARLLKDYGS